MGEIADAIRRARTEGRTADAGPVLPDLRVAPPRRPRTPLAAPVPAPEPEPDPGPAPTPPTERWIETFAPANPAVILDDTPNAEMCRHLALRLRSTLDQRGARSVAVVSAEREDGKTTTACSLAISLATLSRTREIALVDLDLRKPSMARHLAVPVEVGVEEALLGRVELDEVALKVRKPAIDVYAARTPNRNAHEILVLPRLREMIAALEERYAIVVVDTPPAPLVPDANLILHHVPACVPVVRVGKTRVRSVRRLLDSLPREQVLGWVLNDDRASRFGYGDYYYYYGEDEKPTELDAYRGRK